MIADEEDIDDGEWECQTMNCLFGKYNDEENNLYKKSYKDKHITKSYTTNITEQKLRKELINESIINCKRSSMDK